MLPIALLMIEHRQIERMIPLLRNESRRARQGEVDPDRIDALVDFVRTYADKVHHGKEEDILFVALDGKTMPPELRATMERLVQDHKISRSNTRTVAEANRLYRSGNIERLGAMSEALDRLAELYPAHIAIEDRAFFIPSMELFSKEEQTRMLAQFQSFDRALIHQLYRGRMDELAGPRASQPPRTKPSESKGDKFVCSVCDFVYDPARGDPEHGIAPGTSFEDIPDDWICPLCGASKKEFKRLASR